MSVKKKYLFFYLKTVGGHLAPARSIFKYMNNYFADVAEPKLIYGFEKTPRWVYNASQSRKLRNSGMLDGATRRAVEGPLEWSLNVPLTTGTHIPTPNVDSSGRVGGAGGNRGVFMTTGGGGVSAVEMGGGVEIPAATFAAPPSSSIVSPHQQQQQMAAMQASAAQTGLLSEINQGVKVLNGQTGTPAQNAWANTALVSKQS